MAVNSSSPSINYFQNYSSSSLLVLLGMSFIATKFFLVLPLSVLVLYLGLQRWRQQRFFATTSHSDIFTYHSAAVELIFALGVAFYFCGFPFGLLEVMRVGSNLCTITIPGETSFHVLTCVERYLAVVHPVVYRALRQSGGVKLRNISIGCVWLLCFGWICVITLFTLNSPYISYFCFLVLSLVVVSFCSLSVLCVLIRPGPVHMGRDRAQVDQSKQRAFYTVGAILGVLWLCFFGYLVSFALAISHVLSFIDESLVLMVAYWCSLPSSLVLPVLFLQRAGKMVCCQK